MKNKFRAALLAILAGIALPQVSARGQSTAPATQPSQQSTAKPPAKPAAAKPAPKNDAALIAQGKSRFQAYGCKDCHGEHGEGTDDAPDLIGTRLNADQITAFLNKPSADADVKGMPTIPPTSPDLKPLVAFVLSLKGSKPK